ncbi:hypothetical protein BG004_004521 [Podila humilis]|nr:hypothetical protein BG004_004521 [Podila humilis]
MSNNTTQGILGPLDFPPQIQVETTNDNNTAVDTNVQTQNEPLRGRDHDCLGDRNRRRSVSSFIERIRSRSRSRSHSLHRDSAACVGNCKENAEKEYKYSRRKSTEMQGEYADVLRAQVEYMENLREHQAREYITKNVDGLPIPALIYPDDNGNDTQPANTSGGRRRRSSLNGAYMELEEKENEQEGQEEYRFSRRNSAEISGPYAATLQAQLKYMEKLRAEQEKNEVTCNVDGLPIPPSVNRQRRSSVPQIFGLDKKLLSH